MNKWNIIYFLIVLFTSCGIANHSRFTYYKQVLKIEEFRTDGVYYRFSEFHGGNGDDRYFAGLYFFYKDGTVISNSVKMKNSLDKDVASKMTNDMYHAVEVAQNSGGAYIVKEDSLKIQIFGGTQQRTLYSLDILEFLFFVNKYNSSIKFVSSFCNWCPKNGNNDSLVLIPNPEYNFLPLTNKPDSSKLWFKKTKWYKKEVGAK